MLIQQEAKNLIIDNGLLNKIYINNIAAEEINNVDDTIALISDVDRIIDESGNNDIFGLTKNIEIQIFWGLNDVSDDFDFDKFEIKFLRLFKKNNWNIVDIRGNTTDISTHQTTSTYFFSKHVDI